MTRLKAALFVDFDNIFRGLGEIESGAATIFAKDPQRWLPWIETLRLDGTADDEGATHVRDVLVRNMYMHPRFVRFHQGFTRAGFSVMNCPSLTGQDKNSADIRMVLDIVDALEHATPFNEFIIFSGDADFTPVLQRLRAHDRRTAILVAGPAAQAYRSAADALINADEFIEKGLRHKIGGGTRAPSRGTDRPLAVDKPVEIETKPSLAEKPAPLDRPPADLRHNANDDTLKRMADRLYERAATGARVHGVTLKQIYRQFPEFNQRATDWLGFGSLSGLTEVLVRRRPELEIDTGPAGGDWAVRLREKETTSRPAVTQAPLPAAPPTTPLPVTVASVPPAMTPADQAAIGEQVGAIVLRLIAASRTALSLNHVAQEVKGALGPALRESRWAGAGTCKGFLKRWCTAHKLVVSDHGTGYIYDPARHRDPGDDERIDEEALDLPTFAQRVSNVTGTPFLSSEEYQALFEAISDAAENGTYQIGALSVIVRDACQNRGHSIDRLSIQFIIKGIGYGGHKLSDESIAHDPHTLADAFCENVYKLCKNARMELGSDETDMLEDWLMGAPAEHEHESDDDLDVESDNDGDYETMGD